MGFYVEDPASGLTIGQAIYEVALIIAVVRWLLCFIFRVMKDRRTQSADSTSEGDNKSLALTTFGEIVERVPQTEDTCAVCLNQLKMEDEVRELMNCYHVFHKECIDRWLEYEHNPTCPLCRAPCYYCLSTTSSSSSSLSSSDNTSCSSMPPPPPPPHPTWAVDRLLYLFGDDLLPC